MNKLLLSIVAILMTGFLGMTWLAFQQNDRANTFAAELYQREIIPTVDINWTPTYIVIQDLQGRPRARGTIYPIFTVFDTEIK